MQIKFSVRSHDELRRNPVLFRADPRVIMNVMEYCEERERRERENLTVAEKMKRISGEKEREREREHLSLSPSCVNPTRQRGMIIRLSIEGKKGTLLLTALFEAFFPPDKYMDPSFLLLLLPTTCKLG